MKNRDFWMIAILIIAANLAIVMCAAVNKAESLGEVITREAEKNNKRIDRNIERYKKANKGD